MLQLLWKPACPRGLCSATRKALDEVSSVSGLWSAFWVRAGLRPAGVLTHPHGALACFPGDESPHLAACLNWDKGRCEKQPRRLRFRWTVLLSMGTGVLPAESGGEGARGSPVPLRSRAGGKPRPERATRDPGHAVGEGPTAHLPHPSVLPQWHGLGPLKARAALSGRLWEQATCGRWADSPRAAPPGSAD